MKVTDCMGQVLPDKPQETDERPSLMGWLLYALLSYPLNFLFLKGVLIPWRLSAWAPPALQEAASNEELTVLFMLSPITLPIELFLVTWGTVANACYHLVQGTF